VHAYVRIRENMRMPFSRFILFHIHLNVFNMNFDQYDAIFFEKLVIALITLKEPIIKYEDLRCIQRTIYVKGYNISRGFVKITAELLIQMSHKLQDKMIYTDARRKAVLRCFYIG